jgi:hypothetical protein
MRTFSTVIATLCLVLSIQTSARAQDLASDVLNACSAEVETYCSQVTPGEGRLLACFFAHEDKLSSRCVHGLYDAAVRLNRAINALVYVADSCEAEIDKFCADVKPGEGRIAACLNANAGELSVLCDRAMSEVGLK